MSKRESRRRRVLGVVACAGLCFAAAFSAASGAAEPGGGAAGGGSPTAPAPSAAAITHRFLQTGGTTAIIGADGKPQWSYPGSTRDGWVLPSGHVLLAVSKGKPYPGGGAIELDAAGKTLWEYRGTQSEVDTVQPLGGERVLVTESGPKPRLLEVGRDGKVAFEMTLRCQTSNHHMQTRMARKLANGNYLVPHLLDRVVREYRPDGTTAWEFKTPAEVKDAWPFTAIRLPDGHTLVSCTMGHLVVEADAQGKVVWSLSNGDLPEPMLNDACGAQRLPNGNTVVASYRAGSGVKLVEVTREKRVVWTYNSPSKTGIHHFQVLDTQGEALPWPPMR